MIFLSFDFAIADKAREGQKGSKGRRGLEGPKGRQGPKGKRGRKILFGLLGLLVLLRPNRAWKEELLAKAHSYKLNLYLSV